MRAQGCARPRGIPGFVVSPRPARLKFHAARVSLAATINSYPERAPRYRARAVCRGIARGPLRAKRTRARG
eukprot:4717723-Lingulodinium_polyedra.AAC.1